MARSEGFSAVIGAPGAGALLIVGPPKGSPEGGVAAREESSVLAKFGQQTILIPGETPCPHESIDRSGRQKPRQWCSSPPRWKPSWVRPASSSVAFRSLSIRMMSDRGIGSVLRRRISCSMPSWNTRNSSRFRSATRLPSRSLTVTGTTTSVVFTTMDRCPVGGAEGAWRRSRRRFRIGWRSGILRGQTSFVAK